MKTDKSAMRKRSKKLISVLLAASMVVSIGAVSFTAFAASSAATVSAKIEKLTAPAELTPELESEYKGLADTEKEKIDLNLLNKLYNYCYTNNGSAATKFQQTIDDLGPYTANMRAGLDLSKQMDRRTAITYQFEGQEKSMIMPSSIKWEEPEQVALYKAYMALWNNATPYQRSIADIVSNSNVAISTGIKDAFFGMYNSIIMIFSTPKVMKHYEAYLRNEGKTPAEIQTSYENDFVWSPIADVKTFMQTFKNNKIYTYYEGYKKGTLSGEQLYNEFYDKTTKKSTAASSLAALNSAALLKSMSLFVIYTASGPSLGTASTIATDIDTVVNKIAQEIEADIVAKQPMLDFIDRINSVVIPDAPSKEFNATMASIFKDYKNLEYKSQYGIRYMQENHPESIQKYNQIIDVKNVYYTDLINKEGTIHEIFEEEFVNYEMGRPYGDIITQSLIPSIDNIVGTVLPSVASGANLKGVVDKLLFTNANVESVGLMLVGLLTGGVVPDEWTPAAMASNLRNYSDRTALADRLEKCATWDDVLPDFDWGVIPGDFESYCLAVLSVAAPITGLVTVMLPNTLNDTNGDGVYDQITPKVYERAIIPLLEALGAENIMDSMTFTIKSSISSDTVPTAAEAFVVPMMVLKQIYGVFARLLENPVDFLTKNLPNIVYHLEDGCVFDAIKLLLTDLSSFIGPVEGIDGYLSLDGIFGLLSPMLEQAGIKLDINDIKKFAHLGKATVVPSASMTHETTVRVVGNDDSVIRQLSKILEPIALDLLKGLGVDFSVKSEFIKTEAPSYPHNGKMDKKVMLAMVNGFDGLLGGFMDLKKTVGGLMTNENAANIITGLYDMLGKLNLSAFGIALPVTPKDVAAAMSEDRYAELRADLTVEGNTWKNVGLVVKTEGVIDYLANMGFKDGDRDGFINCLVASLRPLVKMLTDANLLTNTEGSLGLYETMIIPLFEALGITPAVNSTTYTENYRKLSLKADKGAAYDYLAKTILSPLLGLLDNLLAAPLDTLLGVLPNLAYAIQYNPDTAFIGNLLNANGGLSKLLTGLLQNLATGEDADGNAIYGLANFVLPEIPLDALASCGRLTTKNSKRMDGGKYTVLAVDKADAFVTVYYYLYDAINYKDNLQTIKNLIAGLGDMDATLQKLIDNVLNDIFTASKEESLCKMGALLASDVWACPDADDNAGKKTPGTGDASIPAIVVISTMLTAGAAIALLRRKKMTEV